MKTSLKKVLLLSASVIVIGSCKKEENKNLGINGTYRGGFSEVTVDGANPGSVASSGTVQISFQSNKFATATSGNFLTVGDGTFEIQPLQVIFHNQDAFPTNTNFNSHAALHDSYSYQVKGDSLYLTQYDYTPQGVPNNFYLYRLKKQ